MLILLAPVGLHLKAIALGGLLWTFNWQWAVLLIATLVLFGSVMVTLSMTEAKYSMTRLLRELNRTNYWRRVFEANAQLIEHRWKKDIDSHLRLSATKSSFTVLLTPQNQDPKFIEPEAFLNAHGCSVILLPNSYEGIDSTKFNRVQRFALYHELAHNTEAGTLIWNGQYLPTLSYGGALILLVTMPNGLSSWITYLALSLLTVLFGGSISSLSRKIKAELYADSQALAWIAEKSVDDALSVCKNRIRIWTNAEDFVDGHRLQNMKNWQRYLTRVSEKRIAIPPLIENHNNPSWWIEYPLAALMIFGMRTASNQDGNLAIVIAFLMIITIAGMYIRYRLLRRVVHSMNLDIIKLLP